VVKRIDYRDGKYWYTLRIEGEDTPLTESAMEQQMLPFPNDPPAPEQDTQHPTGTQARNFGSARNSSQLASARHLVPAGQRALPPKKSKYGQGQSVYYKDASSGVSYFVKVKEVRNIEHKYKYDIERCVDGKVLVFRNVDEEQLYIPKPAPHAPPKLHPKVSLSRLRFCLLFVIRFPC